MKHIIETKKGWTEVIIDDDCLSDKFYKVADLLATKFGLAFSEKLNSLDTIYWDFHHNGSILVLSYNIYEGITIFPREFKNATQADNESVLEIGGLLFQQLIDYNWTEIKNVQTIGTKGSEGGTIIADFENSDGARITLEKECGNIPFAITLGIYGLMFHTHYESDLKIANEYVEQKKFQINKVFELYEVSEEKRDNRWNDEHNKLMDKLADMTEIQVVEEEKPTTNKLLPKAGQKRTLLNFWSKFKF